MYFDAKYQLNYIKRLVLRAKFYLTQIFIHGLNNLDWVLVTFC